MSNHKCQESHNNLIQLMLNKKKLSSINETFDLINKFDSLLVEVLNSSDENKAEIYFKLGYTCFMLGKYLLAADYFKRAMSYSPRLVKFCLGLTYYNKGKLLEKSGNFNAAKRNYDLSISYFDKALHLKGELPTAFIIYSALGQVSYEIIDHEETLLKSAI